MRYLLLISLPFFLIGCTDHSRNLTIKINADAGSNVSLDSESLVEKSANSEESTAAPNNNASIPARIF